MIRSIIEKTGVKIDVEDDGRVNVASADEAAAAKAIGMIQELTATPELNKTYLGKVQRITDFGAFVEIMPAPTACCTSPRSRTTASRTCATS